MWHPNKRFPRSTMALLLAASCAVPVAHAGLVPPPGFTAPVQIDDDGPRTCPAAPAPFAGELDFPSKYEGSDSSRDKANAKSTKIYKDKTAPVVAFEKGFSKIVDQYIKEGHPKQLDCALGWLKSWSNGNALLGKANNHTGKAVRKWALGSIASAYLRLKFSSSQPLRDHAAQAQQAEAWIGRVADTVVEEWRDQPIEKFNNHEYWASWAVMASAVALDRREMFDWSVENFRRAMEQIDADGYLPNELSRETRALQYHNYSLPPLTMIAAFARANGVDLTHENGDALKRLAARTLSGVDDPSTFVAKTGVPQEKDGTEEASKFSWLEPYCWLYGCGADIESRLQRYRPLKTYRIGGDVTALFASSPSPAGRSLPIDTSSLKPTSAAANLASSK